MDKNTIWAIVLSTLVIVGSYFLLPKVFGNKKASAAEQASVEVVADDSASNMSQANETAILTDSMFDEETSALISEVEAAEENAAPAVEQKITINTGVAEVVFTTKGGDIISYKLTGHNDKDTNDFVQLSDSISETNRTCAIAIGGAESKIINEIFNYEKSFQSQRLAK